MWCENRRNRINIPEFLASGQNQQYDHNCPDPILRITQELREITTAATALEWFSKLLYNTASAGGSQNGPWTQLALNKLCHSHTASGPRADSPVPTRYRYFSTKAADGCWRPTLYFRRTLSLLNHHGVFRRFTRVRGSNCSSKLDSAPF